jgi:flagellar motility protein MotE (MotC chaperone)
MAGKAVGIAVIAVFCLCLQQVALFAEGEAQDAIARLNSVRSEMKEIKASRDADVQQVTREIDDKIEAARKEFHRVRDGLLKEKKERIAVLDKAYNEKIRPLKAEEKRLVNIVVPKQSNFAKRREK